MNAEAILALIADLYQQIRVLQELNARLEAQLAETKKENP